jgi:hypothetical protein
MIDERLITLLTLQDVLKIKSALKFVDHGDYLNISKRLFIVDHKNKTLTMVGTNYNQNEDPYQEDSIYRVRTKNLILNKTGYNLIFKNNEHNKKN